MKESPVSIRRWERGRPLSPPAEDHVAREEPLEIRVGGRGVAVTLRTPGHERELVAGFLLSEGVIRGRDDLRDLLLCRDLPGGGEGNVVEAILAPGVEPDFARLTRHVFTSSSCGLCGKATLDSLAAVFPPVAEGPPVQASVLASLGERLREAQPGFATTGGLHAAALFDPDGGLVCVREDVGRHNALDKVLGWALLAGRLPLSSAVLMVSGRLSFELLQKARAGGIPLVAGIGAPSSLAIQAAHEARQTLIGFLRDSRFNVYAGASRIVP